MGTRSYEYPQSMFLSRNKNINVYPCKPQFYYTKVGFKGVKIISIRHVFVMCSLALCFIEFTDFDDGRDLNLAAA